VKVSIVLYVERMVTARDGGGCLWSEGGSGGEMGAGGDWGGGGDGDHESSKV